MALDTLFAKSLYVCLFAAIGGVLTALFGTAFGSQTTVELGGAIAGLGAIGFFALLCWQFIF